MPINQKHLQQIIPKISYYLIRSGFYLWSLLPLSWLYNICRLLAWIIFRVFRYRRHVIARNMEIVFPDSSPEYRKELEKQFIHHFADIIAEMIKGYSMSQDELRHRFDVHMDEEIIKDFQNGQDVFIAGAHINNWEWAVLVAGDQIPARTAVIYKPLSNRAMDQLMIEMRERQKSRMIPMAQVLRDILHKERPVTAYIFLSDQSTPFTMTAHWPIFFGVKTPFVSGMSTIAVRQSIPIYYFNIEKVKRGFYQARFTLLIRDPQNYSPEEITSMYSKKVMEDILNQPACWLWTHKRWKRVLQY